MVAAAKSFWWCLATVFQFIFVVCILYRRVYVYGRSIPGMVEYRGRYIWEVRGKAPDYCFRLFLGHACFLFASIILLPTGLPENIGLLFVMFIVGINYYGYLYEKRRWQETNREVSEAEREMSDKIKDFQKVSATS